jgi:cell division protein FtsB
MISKQTITSKAAILALVLLLLFLGFSKFKQWQNQREIVKQKQTLLAQAEAQQKKNEELKQSLEYINSPNFKESVARQQLGLKKQGEEVYSFVDAQSQANQTQAETKEGNFTKWWNYFFSEEQ